MTEILCYSDSYLREFDATVTEATPKGVVLDRTAFYPGGGGQPSDSGVLEVAGIEYKVAKLSRADGKLVHEIDGDAPDVGVEVHGVLDWDRRQTSLNTHQMTLDGDGVFRAVIALEDPGVPNWLDPAGNPWGTIMGRIVNPDRPTEAEITVVPLSEVRDHLPGDTPEVSAAERTASLRRRSVAAQRRQHP